MPTETPTPTATATTPTNEATPEAVATDEAVSVWTYSTVAPDADGVGVMVGYANTATAGDRTIALLLTALLLVQLSHFVLALWSRPKRARFMTE